MAGLLAPGLALVCVLGALAQERFTGPWDVAALQQVPEHEWGAESNGIREVYYAGLPYRGQPTRVFAWLGLPPSDGTVVPGVILLHGGGQQANADWVRYWMDRGYAALAMDLNGQGPAGALPDGGPRLETVPFFGPFLNGDFREGWIYHAVANVMLAHSLLAAQTGVDPDRLGLNGVSLGGSLACAVAGVDARVRAAAPVYGVGFFNEGGYWMSRTRAMDCGRATEWATWLDPGVYLPGVTCPILFQNGATDRFTPPDTYQRNINACGGNPTLAMRPKINHGNFWKWPGGEIEVNLFLDHHLRGGPAPPLIEVIAATETHVECVVESNLPVVSVQLAYTTDLGPWTQREWRQEELDVEPARFSVLLPEGRPLWALVMVGVKTPSGLNGWFSTPYFFRDAPDSPPRIVLDQPTRADGRVSLTGRKPFGQRVLIEGSADLCTWTKLVADSSPGIDFHVVLSPSAADWRFFRARKWEVMQ